MENEQSIRRELKKFTSEQLLSLIEACAYETSRHETAANFLRTVDLNHRGLVQSKIGDLLLEDEDFQHFKTRGKIALDIANEHSSVGQNSLGYRAEQAWRNGFDAGQRFALDYIQRADVIRYTRNGGGRGGGGGGGHGGGGGGGRSTTTITLETAWDFVQNATANLVKKGFRKLIPGLDYGVGGYAIFSAQATQGQLDAEINGAWRAKGEQVRNPKERTDINTLRQKILELNHSIATYQTTSATVGMGGGPLAIIAGIFGGPLGATIVAGAATLASSLMDTSTEAAAGSI